MNSKPVDSGLVPPLRLLRDQGRVDLEEDVQESGAEVRAVDAVVAGRLRVVDVLAFRAEKFHAGCAGRVVLAHGQEVLAAADDAGAFAEGAGFVFFHLRGRTSTIPDLEWAELDVRTYHLG